MYNVEEIMLRGKRVKVDVRGELEQYDWGQKVRWQEDKLVCPSPFRDDKSPSFFVNLTSVEVDGNWVSAGTWKDSGYEDNDWASGNLIKLLAFLRNESYEETEEYLALMYGIELSYDELTFVSPNLTLEELRKPLPKDFLTPYKFRHPYLAGRGISEKVQRMMRIGYDKEHKAVVIPWILPDGKTVANCKFRAVKGKIFWYAKNALPIKHLIYGIDAVYGTNAKLAVLCEAEIDALTWMTWGVPAIAVGGVHFTEKQADIIKRSPIETLVMGADNDEQGKKLINSVTEALQGHVDLQQVCYPNGYKDANEIMVAGLEKPVYKQVSPFRPIKLQF